MVTRELSAEERENLYDSLLNEAPFVAGEAEKAIKPKQIEWMDPELVKEGQLFVRRNFFAILLAHLAALLYGFSFRRLSTVLLRTGKSAEVEDSIARYLSTLGHFKVWYETDIVGEYGKMDEKGYQDILRVRSMHVWALRKAQAIPLPSESELQPTAEKLELAEAIRTDLACIKTAPLPQELKTYNPQVPMSQFDMVMTQFGLVSIIFLFPNTLGVKDTRGLMGFLHLWAIFGRLLGIEDRFNIALHPDRELYKKLYMNVGIGSLKESDLAVVTLQKSFIDGLFQMTHFGTVKSYLYHGLRSREALPAFEGKNLYKIMSWWDLFYYFMLRFILFIYPEVTLFREFMNYSSRAVLQVSFKKYLKTGKK